MNQASNAAGARTLCPSALLAEAPLSLTLSLTVAFGGLVLIMGPETVLECLAFMTGPAVEAFLTRSTTARLPCTAAMHIDISHSGRSTARSFLA